MDAAFFLPYAVIAVDTEVNFLPILKNIRSLAAYFSWHISELPAHVIRRAFFRTAANQRVLSLFGVHKNIMNWLCYSISFCASLILSIITAKILWRLVSYGRTMG